MSDKLKQRALKDITIPPNQDFPIPVYDEEDGWQDYDHYLLTMVFNLVVAGEQAIIRASISNVNFAAKMQELIDEDIVKKKLTTKGMEIRERWKLTDKGREIVGGVVEDIQKAAAEEPS